MSGKLFNALVFQQPLRGQLEVFLLPFHDFPGRILMHRVKPLVFHLPLRNPMLLDLVFHFELS